MPNGNVASIDPSLCAGALHKPKGPDPPSVSVAGVALVPEPGTNCVGRTISGATLVASPGAAVGRGVLVGSGVDVDVGISVGVAVGGLVGTGVGVGSGVLVGVGIGVLVGVNVGVKVGVKVGVSVGVAVGVGVNVGVGVSVGVGVTVGVSVGVGVGVNVGNRSGKTSVTFSKGPPANGTGGEIALRKRGAPEGSLGSIRKNVTGAFRYFLSIGLTVMKYSEPNTSTFPDRKSSPTVT